MRPMRVANTGQLVRERHRDTEREIQRERDTQRERYTGAETERRKSSFLVVYEWELRCA